MWAILSQIQLLIGSSSFQLQVSDEWLIWKFISTNQTGEIVILTINQENRTGLPLAQMSSLKSHLKIEYSPRQVCQFSSAKPGRAVRPDPAPLETFCPPKSPSPSRHSPLCVSQKQQTVAHSSRWVLGCSSYNLPAMNVEPSSLQNNHVVCPAPTLSGRHGDLSLQ